MASSNKIKNVAGPAGNDKKTKSNFFLSKAFRAIKGYFKGSWQELGEVRWPNRKSTWAMTLAVVLFTGFFVVMIVLLDFGFNNLFNLIFK